MNRESFHQLVRRILNEEITKRVPEMNANGVDPNKKNKTFSSDPNTRDKDPKNEILDEFQKAVKAVNPDYNAYWDDHDDLRVDGGDMASMWVTPLWEDNYKIVFMPRGEDRFFFTGLNWKQVLEFVKENLDQKKHTHVEIARDRSWRNQKDQVPAPDKGLNQEDKPKIKPLTNEPVNKTKNREKDYTEDQVKDERDLPEKPMRESDEFKPQRDHKAFEPPHPRGKPVMGKGASYKKLG